MTRRTLYATAIAAAAFCLPDAPASATHVPCGTTITTTTTLDSDVQCAAGEPYGLIIGASNVKVLLNGYTVRGVSDGNEAGIYSPCCFGPFPSRVSIKGGAIEGFTAGVHAGLDDSVLHKLSVRVPGQAINLHGDRNTFTNNSVTSLEVEPRSDFGINVVGDDAYLWGNQVNNEYGWAISTEGARTRVVYNQVVCTSAHCADSGYAQIGVTGIAPLVNRNTVQGGYAAWGIAVYNSSGSRVTLNDSRGNFKGIEVQDSTARVGRNVANNNGAPGSSSHPGYGIVITNPGTTLRNNTTNNNGNYGIYVANGDAVDGGGNVASGNGDGTTPQCFNFPCSSP